MAVILPPEMPALATLADEGVEALAAPATGAPGRRLEIAIFNLMPKKTDTELQLARMLGRTSGVVSITWAAPNAYAGKNAPPEHMDRFYRRWRDVRNSKFDAVIITGAPIETMAFEDVAYWGEITEILDWIRDAETPLLSLCWGAQAALYRYYGVPKHLLPAKRFGIFDHTLADRSSPFVQALDDEIKMPVSRWTETRTEDLAELPHLKPLLTSKVAGLGALADERLGHLHVLNHFEYDPLTLDAEFKRDREKGAAIIPPENYYPDDDPEKTPPHSWRANANAFYGAWVRWLLALKSA